MLHLSDKELDQLSQEAARQYDPGLEHSPGSWEKLEWQLTKEIGRTRPGFFRTYRRIPFLYAPIVVLLVGVSYFMVKKGTHPANGSPPETILRALPPGAPSDAAKDPLKNERSVKNEPSPKIEIPQNNSTTENKSNTFSASGFKSSHSGNNRSVNDPKSTRSISPDNASPREKIVSNTGGDSRISVPGSTGNSMGYVNSRKKLFSHFLKRKRRRNKKDSPMDPLLFSKTAWQPTENKLINAGNQLTHFIYGIPLSVPGSHIRPIIDDSALRAWASNKAGNTSKSKAVNPGKNRNRSLHINSPLQIGILYAPDFTIVKSIEGNKPGHSLGLTIGYGILNRVSLNTGLLWTRQNYTALAEDFHPPQGSWFNNNNMVQLHYVQGSVDMLEIPLNIRYEFKMPSNGLFYFQGGVSSYIVGDEDCIYYYQNYGMNRFAPEHDNDRKAYWFSALNLAMGIEKPISRSLSFQAEPYLKLPLSGVGTGNVQLNSFGINFSLKYAPVLGKSRR